MSSNVKKAGLGYVLGNYLIRGISFITLPLFARLLSTADFGIYNMFVSYSSIVFILIGVAIHTSYKNAYIKFKDEFDEYVSNTILICIIVATFFTIIGILFPIIYHGISFFMIYSVIIYSFALAIIANFNAYVSLQFKSSSYVKIATVNALSTILISVFLILCIFDKQRYIGRILGTTIPAFLISLFLIVYFFRKQKPKLNRSHFTYALTYSLPLIPHGISQVVLSSVDRIMIANMVGNEEAGLYSFAYTLQSLISVMYSSLDQVWGPWFYEKFRNNELQNIRIRANQYAWSLAILSSMAMLVSPELISIIGGSAYVSSKMIVTPIVLSGFFTFMYNFPAVVEYYFEKTQFISTGTVLAAVVNLTLNFLFIPKYGYGAAAYTTLFTYILYFLLHYVFAYYVNQRKQIYSTKTFTLISLFVISISIFVQLNLEKAYLRWVLLLLLVLYFSWYLFVKLQLSIRSLGK